MDERTLNLVAECRRQEESCLYTSTSIFEWLKRLRIWRGAFVVGPLILGALATWPLLAKDPEWNWFVGVCALLAGVTPAIYKALKLDLSLDMLTEDAHHYKILQDRFRQAASVTALGEFDAFKAEFDALMERMDGARARSHTPPDKFFEMAQKKVKRGDYDFSVDLVK